MSSAHRPTWDPAKARADVRQFSKNFSAKDAAAHTKLKFRQPTQIGVGKDAGGTGLGAEVARRDLRLELQRAERKARDEKRKAAGLPVEEDGDEDADGPDAKRLKLIQEAAKLDADDDDDEDEDDRAGAGTPDKLQSNGAENKGKGRASDTDSDESDSDSDDEEDDTAALLRELAKIKKERAEEAARLEQQRQDAQQGDREDAIALGNPLLNLEHAMGVGPGDTPRGGAQSGPRDFGVKRRWDEDVIFKNQAAGSDTSEKRGFVNDLTRSEFHRRFMNRYVR